MSRELIATDKNPCGGIKKKEAAHPTSPPPVCLSRRTLIILNKPSAAQLTIRKPCSLAQGIHANPPHHRRLHVLPISAATVDGGRRGCLPSQPARPPFKPARESRLRKAAAQPNSGVRVPGVPLAPGHVCGEGVFLEMGFLQYCDSAAGVICGEPVLVVDGASPHRRGKVRPDNDECLASW